MITIKTDTMKTNPVNQGRQSMAWLLLLTFCFEIFFPATVRAGGGGPTQPEVHGFTPIGVSDMVDPFTGDFSYNIPLMDVEGYPINISYNAGISMDQEASWVGLGWNLNVGTVVRNMRGLPDDFNGDMVEHTTYMKPNRTISLDAGLNAEFFGKEVKKNQQDTSNSISINASMGINYNNYNGYSTEFSFGPSFNFSKTVGQTLTSGFSLSGSSENGSSFAPSLSFAKKVSYAGENDLTRTTTIGSALNSRAGLMDLSFQNSYNRAVIREGSKTGRDAKAGINSGISSSYDLGLAHYSPSSGPSMFSTSLSGRLKVGGLTFWGVDGSFSLGISYSSQWIPDDQVTINTPSYGYFFLENGQKKEKAQLDFNRDNDGSFTKYTPNLPSAFLTYDLFSIQAQGASGSYRGFRNEVGYVFDPKVTTNSASGSFGLEFGLGNFTDFGLDLSVCITNSHTGGWDGSLNKAKDIIEFEHVNAPLETYALQDASESSVDTDPLMTQMGGVRPAYFPITGALKFVSLQDKLKNNYQNIDLENNNRNSRIKRNQVMQFLTHRDLTRGFGLNYIDSEIHVGAQSHHIGEITQLGTDGRRYIFGIAAYNHFQEDVTFATGVKTDGNAGIPVTEAYDGLINYGGNNPVETTSPNNIYGIDHYYNSTLTPAYAHSFLLTAVLSDDYIDSDTTKGPSQDDLGAYVKFDYEKVDSCKWRSPMPLNKAFRNEGLKVNVKDDKASFTYGQKDLWYVKAIETKNYVAVFTLEDRIDGASAYGRHGGFDTLKRMKLLRKITLYSRPDYEAHIGDLSNATPLQEVNFVYDYSLCQLYPANTSVITDEQGKLTLKEIFFTYQGSGKMKRSSYTFEYNGENPDYNMKAVDRWGNYKATSTGLENTMSSPMNNADYPYTPQNQSEADDNSSAWSLTAINLPSGGRMEVEYESDDYAYVQHLQAMQMFQIVGTENSINDGDTNLTDYEVHSVSTGGEKNQAIYFRMKSDYEKIGDYVKVGQFFYFRCLVDFREDEGNPSTTKYDYVSGYGMVGAIDTIHYQDSIILGKISFVGERLRDGGASEYSPITKFALQFGRMHLSQYVVGNSPDDPGEGEGSLTSFANSVVNAFSSFEELFDGPNKPIWEEERGREIVMNKSWVRLFEPSHKKLGGGHRVKRILMYDNWDAMTADNTAGFSYGQEFTYTLEDGTSSGVASYEPQIGGDENPWHKPIPYSNKIRWGTDDKLYQEEPLMESQFPSPNVGYSRVEIRDLKREGVSRTATGKVVKEFYTAKDFPTIVKTTDVAMKTSNSFLPVLPKYQYMTASQGFTIELNDMHGKPKKESIYSEGNDASPLSTVDYFYKQENLNMDGVTNFKLTNNVNTINSQGVQSTAEIGVKYEAVSDFRESKTLAIGGTIAINTNSFLFGFVPIVLPTIWPSIDVTDNQFHSATLNKVVNRFGILEKVRANQDGSIVETNNLAYDAETGELLATQTTTNFNDKVYSLNYPAYWHYDQLGQAYRNIGVAFGPDQDFSNSGFTAISSANSYFVEGDELAISSTSGTHKRGWVLGVVPSGISVVDSVGVPITLQNTAIKVIRSGRRNKQTTSMASLTSLSNPLSSILSNVYPNVLNAGAVEFSQDWKTYCNCFKTEFGVTTNVNPYTLGTLGNWRPVRSFTHLSGRTQSNFDGNTNIRRDGVFASYTPYYRLQNGQWNKNQQNWTYVSEVTAFSPNGMVLETRDALGRYGASLFGYNSTLTTAVAANTRLQQVAYVGFEDIDYTNCMDQQLELGDEGDIERDDAHTGHHSLKVQTGSPIVFVHETIDDCTPTTCALNITEEDDDLFLVNDCTIPLTLEIEVISGEVDASIQGTKLISIEGNVSDYYELKVTVTDANGCQIIQLIKND